MGCQGEGSSNKTLTTHINCKWWWWCKFQVQLHWRSKSWGLSAVIVICHVTHRHIILMKFIFSSGIKCYSNSKAYGYFLLRQNLHRYFSVKCRELGINDLQLTPLWLYFAYSSLSAMNRQAINTILTLFGDLVKFHIARSLLFVKNQPCFQPSTTFNCIFQHWSMRYN